jgi:hypothetical protein
MEVVHPAKQMRLHVMLGANDQTKKHTNLMAMVEAYMKRDIHSTVLTWDMVHEPRIMVD